MRKNDDMREFDFPTLLLLEYDIISHLVPVNDIAAEFHGVDVQDVHIASFSADVAPRIVCRQVDTSRSAHTQHMKR